MTDEREPTPFQAWLALFLTSGEFVAGSWLLVHDGHVLALYLAITYAVRETTGGHHYHDIVVRMCRATARKFRRKRREATIDLSDGPAG